MVTVVEYDPAWPDRFAALRTLYARALDAAAVPYLSIEHVGSTSVPGLAAKPIIDIDIVVSSEQVTAASDVLAALGFVPQGELGIPHRWAFREPPPVAGTHTYVVLDGCLALRNHLAVRDILRANDVLRAEYADAKKRAAATAINTDGYVRAKNTTVQRILAVAGFSEAERNAVDSAQGHR